jgi:predicted nucleic acid-binding protein
MKFLLDTCVISELMAKRPNQAVIQWIESIDEDRLYLSVITIGEIRKGIAKLADSTRKLELQEWLSDQLLSRFDNRIVAIDTGVMLDWGQLVGNLERLGKPMPLMDSLIAAIVLHGDFVLVTRNEADFAWTDARILNPFKSLGDPQCTCR